LVNLKVELEHVLQELPTIRHRDILMTLQNFSISLVRVVQPHSNWLRVITRQLVGIIQSTIPLHRALTTIPSSVEKETIAAVIATEPSGLVLFIGQTSLKTLRKKSTLSQI